PVGRGTGAARDTMAAAGARRAAVQRALRELADGVLCLRAVRVASRLGPRPPPGAGGAGPGRGLWTVVDGAWLVLPSQLDPPQGHRPDTGDGGFRPRERSQSPAALASSPGADAGRAGAAGDGVSDRTPLVVGPGGARTLPRHLGFASAAGADRLAVSIRSLPGVRR